LALLPGSSPARSEKLIVRPPQRTWMSLPFSTNGGSIAASATRF
jgi:hypothetical protein